MTDPALATERPTASLAGPVDRVSFFAEQQRRRGQSVVYSALCLVVAAGLGIVVSAFLSPLVMLIAGGLLELAARLGLAPAQLLAAAHAIGAWAAQQSALIGAVIDGLDRANGWPQYRALLTQALGVAQVFLPGMAAMAVIWLWIRALVRRSGMADLVLALQARPPGDDLEERQLGNLVEEMALAAGLPPPRLLVVDADAANAAAIGTSHKDATILVTRGLLERCDRAETAAIVAHLMGSIGNGDLGVVRSLIAIFASLAFLHTMLDLSFRLSAWPAMARFMGAALWWRTAPETLWRAMSELEASLDLGTSFALAARPFNALSQTWIGRPLQRFSMVFKVIAFPYMLILLVIGMQKFALAMWSLFFLQWPVGLVWRMRRYLADSTAIQLTRDPGALARALRRLAAEGGLPPGGERRDYLFVQVPQGIQAEEPQRELKAAGPQSSVSDRLRVIAEHRAKRDATPRDRERPDRYASMSAHLQPSLANRLKRIDAQGASLAGAGPSFWRAMPRGPMLAIIAVLAFILVPLVVVALALVLLLIAFAIELGLLAGLGLVTAVLGSG
jgi:Zn-dependent protease with chaperone function